MWPAPDQVKAWFSTRLGGVSLGSYQGLNLGDHVLDCPKRVAENRQLLEHQGKLPEAPRWLAQVHGAHLVAWDETPLQSEPPQADGSFSTQPDVVCAVLTADCVPVLFCDRAGTFVAAVHAGWRSLAQGILAETVRRFAGAPDELLIWFGPAISQQAYEVSAPVRDTFISQASYLSQAFEPSKRLGHWQMDLIKIARLQLKALNVQSFFGGQWCTYADPIHFYSHRRAQPCGRMSSLIYLASSK